MPGKAAKRAKKKSARQPEDEQATGLWLDTSLLSKLYGRRSSPLAAAGMDADSQRLLHYADVVLGTDKKEKFVSVLPTKTRKQE
jgi:hypothetical protein